MQTSSNRLYTLVSLFFTNAALRTLLLLTILLWAMSSTGNVSVSSSGVATLSNTAPVGTHTTKIRATDNYNQATDVTFGTTMTNCADATLVTFSNLTVNGQMYRYRVTPTSATLDLTFAHPDLQFPHHGIVIPTTGDLLVSDKGTNASGNISSFLRFKNPLGAMTYSGKFNTPDMVNSYWLAIRNNELFVPQGVNRNNILRFLLDANGNLTPNGSIADGLANGNARGIVLTPWGELFVTRCSGSNYIVRYKFDANGNASLNGIISGNGMSNPHGMAFSSWGELFVASHDNNIVSRFTFDANRNAAANGQIINAAGLAAIDVAFSPWGELFISNNLGAKITRFRFDSARNATFSSSFDTPNALHGLLFLQPSSVCTLPPTVTTLGVTSQAGSPAVNAQLGTATDYEDAEEILQLQISSDGTNFGSTATLNGVTVTLTDSNAGATGINPNSTGQVFANVVAACGASNTSFTLKVTDSGGLMTTTPFTVTVSANTPPTLSYNKPAAIVFGMTTTVNPASGPSDNGGVASLAVQSKGTFTGDVSVNSSGVVTLSNAAPVGTHTITIRATDNCNQTTDATFDITVSSCADATLVTFSNLTVNGQMYRYRVTPTSATLDLTFTHPDLQFPHHGIVIPTTGDLLVSDKGTNASGNISSFLRFKDPLGAMTYSGKFNTPDMISSFWLAIRNNELFVPQGVNNMLRFLLDANGNLTPNGIITDGLANGSARGIVLTPWGELFVTRCCGNDYIVRYKFDANGNASLNGIISGNGMSNPHGMAFSSWGELFVASHDNNTVSRFTFDANRNASANGQIINAAGLAAIDVAFSPWGELFISNNLGAKITRFRFDSARNASFNGSFDTPNALHGLLFLQPSSVCTLPPTVTTLGVTSQAGSPAVNAQLGTATDTEDAEEVLQLQISSDGITFGNSATLNGITVTLTDKNPAAAGTNPDSVGKIFADMVAACDATSTSFTIRATDSSGVLGLASLAINVTANSPPVLSYNPAAIAFSASTTVNPATGPSDNGSISSIVVQSVSPSIAPGMITVNNSSGVVTIPNNIPAGTYTVTIRATDNCSSPSSVTDASFALTVQPIDYTVTTAGNAIVVTDVSGNADTLSVTEPSAGNIKFAAAGRNFKINGGAIISGDSGNLSLAGIDSITVNQGNGNDTANVSAFTFNLPSLTINGDAGDDTVNLNGDIIFAANANLDVDLQNDNATPGVDAVNVAANANLMASGLGTIIVNVSKNIVVNPGASLTTAAGNLTLLANQQATPTTGNFDGVTVNGGLVRAMGAGNVTVKGQGGSGSGNGNLGVIVLGPNAQILASGGAVLVEGTGGPGTSADNFGVLVNVGGVITNAGSGAGATVTVRGKGGNLAGIPHSNYGVYVANTNSQITANGGAVLVEGTGGGWGRSTDNHGVIVQAGGVITNAGSGEGATVTVKGFGGNLTGTGGNNYGVYIVNAGAQITANGGAVLVEGTGGGAGATASNLGVFVLNGGAITNAGTGAGATVTIKGFGGNLFGTGGDNPGVVVNSENSRITSSGGVISVTGNSGGGGGTNSSAIRLELGGQVVGTTGTPTVTLCGDSMEFQSTPSVNAGTNPVVLKPRTAGTLINLGGADVLSGSPLTLGLTDAELDQVTAGLLTIGDNSSGTITVSADITSPASTSMSLVSGGDVTLSGGQINTGGGTLLLDPGVAPFAVKPIKALTDVTASTLSFGSDLAIVINGTTVDTQYQQLNVVGAVNITGVDLALSGAPALVGGESFVIVNNDGGDPIIGAFNGLPQGSLIPNFLGSGLTGRISYIGGTGNDVVITINAPPVIAAGMSPSRQQGSPGAIHTIATVNDAETSRQNLAVTVLSVPAGISITSLSQPDATTGAVTATIAADCSAALGDNTVLLKVTDIEGAAATVMLNVIVTANTAPSVGSYANTGVATTGSITITPNAAPADNGVIQSITATASPNNFSSSFNANISTGAISITNAGPSGTYTITVTVTDNCGATAQKTFVLTVNTAPTINAVANSWQQGSPASNSTIANVADVDGGALVVTVNSGASATVNGVMVSNLAVNNGVVTADIIAGCSATDAGFTLAVTDNQNAMTTATLNVSVTANTAPTLSYNAQSTSYGSALTVIPATVTDNGSIASFALQSQGTYTGAISVNSATGAVTFSNVQPVGQHTITIRATDNCNLTKDASFTLTVAQAGSITSITADSPDSSAVGQNVTVSFSVAAAPPGAGTPTGTVTVGDGVASCTGALSNGGGSCVLALTTAGNRTLTATYAGDANFTGSSATESHTVVAPPLIAKSFSPNAVLLNQPTTLTITITNPAANTVALTGVGLTDNFPAGLEVDATPMIGNSCNTGGFAPVAGATSLSLSNATIPVGVACTFSVKVKATTPGLKTNTTGAVSSGNGGNGLTASAQLQVNGPPVIAPIPLNLAAGSAAKSFDIATINDAEDGPLPLVFRLSADGNTFGTSASKNGVTVNFVSVGADGKVKAEVSTSCTATTATFTLKATDRDNQMTTVSWTVTIAANTPPTLSYAGVSVPAGATPSFTPAGSPADNGAITGINLQSITPATGLALSVNNSTGVVTVTNASIGGMYTVVIRATDDCGLMTDASFTVQVGCPAISLGPATLPTAAVNTAYPHSLTASPAGTNYNFAVTGGALPAGLTLNANGSFSGAPTNSGVFNFLVTVSGWGGGCTAFRDYVLVVDCPTVTVNPANLPGGTVGTNYNQTISASPSGSYGYRVTSGALPPGLTLNAATGAIAGTPTQAGSFAFTVTAAVGGCSGARGFTLVIGCPTITLPALSAATAGVSYTGSVAASPGGDYVYSLLSGNLPAGMTLNPATGALTGSAAVTGTYNFTAKALAANRCSGSQSYSLAVVCPTVTLSALNAPALNVAYSQAVTALPAGGNYSFAVVLGVLPAGLSLNPASGLLSGTPNLAGTYNFTIAAAGFGGCAGNREYSFVIGGAGCPAISLPGSLPAGSVGQLYTQTVTASPVGTYSYAVATGSLPPGVTLFGSQGSLYGYPTAPGSYSFTIRATGANNCAASQSYSVNIGLGMLPESLPQAVVGQAYRQTLTAPGAQGETWFTVVAGALPAEMTLSREGVLSGTPKQPGTHAFTVQAGDSAGFIGKRDYVLVFPPIAPPLITALTMTAAIEGCATVGSTATVTMTVKNILNNSISAVEFESNMPAGTVSVATSCTANLGTCTATPQRVNWLGSLNPNQIVTISFRVQFEDFPSAQTCITATARALSIFAFSASASVCAVNCVAAGPGLRLATTSPPSDVKAGSVLIYNLYTSATDPTQQNTRLSITNTDPSRQAFVHLFFVDGASCSVADGFLCLTPNQTTTFLASDLDPGTTGYIVAVAVDAAGCPTNFNFLIGDEFVKFQSGHAANLSALAVTAIAGSVSACDANASTAQLNFDGVSYAAVPRALALDNLPSRADGNDTMLILNRIGGNLGTGAATLGSIFGILYDDAESSLSFSLTGGCQLRGSLTNNFPRTAPRLEQFIPAGRSGWMKLYSQSDATAIGLTGAAINFNTNATANAAAFNQGHNLHALTTTGAMSYVVPVFPPNC